MYDISQLKKKLLPELQKISEDLSVENYKKYKKIDLIYQILDKQSLKNDTSKENTNKIKKNNIEKRKPYFKNKNGYNERSEDMKDRKKYNQGSFKRKEYDIEGIILILLVNLPS